MKDRFIKKYCAGCKCFYFSAWIGENGGCAYHEDFIDRSATHLEEVPECPRGKDYLRALMRKRRRDKRASRRIKLSPRKRHLLRDLRTGIIAGLVAGIVYLIEFVILK